MRIAPDFDNGWFWLPHGGEQARRAPILARTPGDHIACGRRKTRPFLEQDLRQTGTVLDGVEEKDRRRPGLGMERHGRAGDVGSVAQTRSGAIEISACSAPCRAPRDPVRWFLAGGPETSPTPRRFRRCGRKRERMKRHAVIVVDRLVADERLGHANPAARTCAVPERTASSALTISTVLVRSPCVE